MAEDMEDELSCSICTELYEDPMQLPCMHTLCKVCLDQVLASNTIECPQCRQELDVQHVKTNFQLAAIIEIYKSERTRRETQRQRESLQNDEAETSAIGAEGPIDHSPNLTAREAESCTTCERDPRSAATIHCSTCPMSFCGECLAMYYPLTATKSHDVKPIKEIQAHEECILCEKEKWAVYCMECQMLFCRRCQTDHHPNNLDINHWLYKQDGIASPTADNGSHTTGEKTVDKEFITSMLEDADELMQLRSGLLALMLLKQAVMLELTSKAQEPQ